MSKYGNLFGANAAEGVSPPLSGDTAGKYALLFVDDEPGVLKALTRVFEDENYQVLTAPDGEQALKVLEKNTVQLVISDFMMPRMNGAQFLSRVKSLYPDMIRIMLTGHADTRAVMGAINEGAVYKFILKPWHDDDLRITVAVALEQYELKRRNKQLEADNQRKQKQIKTLNKLAVTNRSQIAIMLHKRHLITDRQLQEIYKIQSTQKAPILKVILDRGWVDEKRIRTILREELMVQEVDLKEFRVEQDALDFLTPGFCTRQLVLPLKINGNRLTLATADPMDEGMISDLQFITGLQIEPVMANIRDILEKIKDVYRGETDFSELEAVVGLEDPFESVEIVIEDDDDISVEELLKSTEEPPAVRLVNAIIIEAVRLGVSDIHIHPRSKHVAVRYRIDGILQDKIHVPLNYLRSIVSRIKVMSELDISERRRPQDGRITVKTPLRMVDLRISTLPTINGEKVVLRLLDKHSSIYSLEDQGFSSAELVKVKAMIRQPQGIILVTGPTGSGKTTTLYTLLQHNATSEKNYVTIEDPVEFYMDLAGQVSVHGKINLDFSAILRAILRQDPDVILLGEIRDHETAEVAFHAAMTGHLVYSTLHTNSALATISRLIDIGLRPFVVATGLTGVIAQRLLRKICVHCKQSVTPDRDLLKLLGPGFEGLTSTSKGTGCERCHNSGYSGRIPIYEVLLITEAMRDTIYRMGEGAGCNSLMLGEHQPTLFDSALQRVRDQLTSPEEVLRVLGPRF